jgi:hypothetical protein
MRQVLATSFVLLSFLYFEKGNYIKLFTVLFVAIGFHVSSLVYVLYPLFWIFLKNKSKLFIFLFVISSFVVGFFIEQFSLLLQTISFAGVGDKVGLYITEDSYFQQFAYQTATFWILVIAFLAITLTDFCCRNTFMKFSFMMFFVMLTANFAEISQRFMILPYLYLPVLYGFFYIQLRSLKINDSFKIISACILGVVSCIYSSLVYNNDSFIYNLYGY